MKRSQSGYSLIEALAALMVLGATFVLLVGGLGTTRRIWDRLDRTSSAVDSVVAAQHLLRERLERTFPQTRFDASAPYVFFAGESDHVTFLAPAPAAAGRQVLQRYDLTVSAEGDLVLASRSDLALDPAGAQRREILLHGVDAISLAYYGGSAWLPRWQSRATLPELVRLRVAFQSGDARFSPDLIVHPAATVDSLCVLDVRTGHCRGRA